MKNKKNDEKKAERLEKVNTAAKKAGQVTSIVLNVIWVLFGLAILSLLIFVCVRFVQAVRGDWSAFFDSVGNAFNRLFGK